MSWEELEAIALIDLGLTAADFRRLTGRKLRALLRRHEERLKREDWRFAFLAAMILNALGASKKPLEPGDLMPWLKEKKEPMEPAEMVKLLKQSFPSEKK